MKKLFILFIAIVLLAGTAVHSQQNPFYPNQKGQQQASSEQLAFNYYRQKDFEKALVLFRDLYNNDLTQRYYTYYLNTLLELNKVEEAEKVIKKQLRKNGDNFKYHVDLGYIYSLQDKQEKAEKEYEEVLNNLPRNENLIRQISNAFIHRNQHELALKTLIKGEEMLSGAGNFNLEKASLYYRTGNFEKMIGEYVEYISKNPGATRRVKNRLQFMMDGLAGDDIEEMLRRSLLVKNQERPDAPQFAEMLLWLSIQKKDFEFALIQAKSLDRRFNEDGKRVFDLAKLSVANDNYQVAGDAFQYLINKGKNSTYYYQARIGYLKSRFWLITETPDYTPTDLEQLNEAYEKAFDELGLNAYTIKLSRDFAHLKAFYLGELQDAAGMLEMAIEIPNAAPPEVAECKLELGDIYLFMNRVWDATLLYSQVEKAFKNDALGHEAKFRNARLFYYIGEFDWAKTQLDVLKAATTKLIANDALELSLLISDNMTYDSTAKELRIYAKADLYFYRNKHDSALYLLDSMYTLSGYHPIKDEILFKKAQISTELGDYELADSLYAKVGTEYAFDILADNALFRRAEINELMLKNEQKAAELYQQLLSEHPGSIFVIEARKRFRALRGDLIN